MPATEQTWRNPKKLHVIFGISSLAMLATTIWMMAADHNREWKHYQREFGEVETQVAQSRIIQQDNEQYREEQQHLEDALASAQREVPDKDLLDKFEEEVARDAKRRKEREPDFKALELAHRAIAEAEQDDKPAARRRFFDQIDRFVAAAKYEETEAATKKKFASADFDVARSRYEQAVGEGKSDAQATLQETVDKVSNQVEDLALLAEDAKAHRKELERIAGEMQADEAKLTKALADHRQKLKQLVDARIEREDSFGRELLEMPILDAFGRPLKIDQIWLPKLTIAYGNFGAVARFDRCDTCHQAIDKTAPGSAIEPGYRHEFSQTLAMQTPKAPEADDESDDAADQNKPVRNRQLLLDRYGLQLAQQGLLKKEDVTLAVVRRESLGAQAGLQVGDVIEQLGNGQTFNHQQVYDFLLKNVKWGQPVSITVRRGLPNPYVSHPKLDLFVGSLSPHKLQDVGCTICHDGQGSATEFKWASHTPDTPLEAVSWTREHGWFDNHHWIFPMNPKRFVESGCLKCHHDVTELEASDRYPDPPAPKLMAGYNLIRQYGCYGCHEINGFDGPNKRVGPDMRTEPNYSAAAQALLAGGDLNDQEKQLAEKVAGQPDNDASRHSLQEAIRAGGVSVEGKEPRLSADALRLANVLDDVETPGRLRKVGPSLRHVASKADYAFLYSWIRRPKDFRPATRMPQFFGLHDHLEPAQPADPKSEKKPHLTGLEASQTFEPIEIRGVVEYLLAKSQPFESAGHPTGVEKGSAERGQKLFETRGCLACHRHAKFPQATMTQGPDLSNVGGKFGRKANAHGPEWLYTWLRNPSGYHPRTLMPNLFLEPTTEADGEATDPDADIVAFLLDSGNWKPQGVPKQSYQLSEQEQTALHDLALDHLKTAFGNRMAEKFLKNGGIPESRRAELKGDEIELLGVETDPQKALKKQLLFVGRRTISKYGCSGCHDIPGFEDAKPIGTGLADWGRKAPDKLAFEQITAYLTRGHGVKAAPPAAHSATTASNANRTGTKSAATKSTTESEAYEVEAEPADAESEHELNFANMGNQDTAVFLQALFGHQREGFIWQKLHEPRSYDYKKTQNKGYNERLRMPQFNLNDEQIEAIITFVRGLVSEPPAAQYVYKASPRQQAITDGLRIAEKYNCTGCHILKMERWQIAYRPTTDEKTADDAVVKKPGDFKAPPEVDDYPFLRPQFSPKQLKASLDKDARGLRHATLTGMPKIDYTTGKELLLDDEHVPLPADDTTTPAFYQFTLWDNALIDGNDFQPGVNKMYVPKRLVGASNRYEAVGGYLAKLIFPKVVQDAVAADDGFKEKADEAWAWLPPPLVNEGRKVQSAWLHDFLLDPFRIRPAVVLRMPKFNMSSAEASKLANYFAAVDNTAYPYDFDSRTRDAYLEQANEKYEQKLPATAHRQRLNDAMRLVTDNNYCVKCHLVGDFSPDGKDRGKAPRLDQVYKRMRPDYLRAWLANPVRLLPYTVMPQNITVAQPITQELFHGESLEQVDGLVDLLLNYDRFAESQSSVKARVKPTDKPPEKPTARSEPPANDAAAR